MATPDPYTFNASWSYTDNSAIGQCVEFPSLSYLAPTVGEALLGIKNLVAEVLADMARSGELPPEPLSLQKEDMAWSEALTCDHCCIAIDEGTFSHWFDGPNANGYGHRGLCCDCMDLSCGMPLEQLNEERAAKGRPAIENRWPKTPR